MSSLTKTLMALLALAVLTAGIASERPVYGAAAGHCCEKPDRIFSRGGMVADKSTAL